MKIQFLGAAGEVTGSRYSVEVMLSGKPRQFMVDYGMFQGGREATSKNLEPLLFPPKDLDFIVLTHAHIDHSGLLPRLCAQGFKGPIYCTGATLELLKILLPDSAYLQRADVDRAERKKKAGKWRGEMPVALYSSDEVEMTLMQFEVVEYGQKKELAPGIMLEFRNAGHILGACSIVLHLENKILVFSGDIGRDNDVLMYPPTKPKKADYLFLEST